MLDCLVLLLHRVRRGCVASASCRRALRCIPDLPSCQWLRYLLAFLRVLYFDVRCREALVSRVVVGFADFLHSVIVRHVQSLVGVDTTLGMGLSSNSCVVLVVESSGAIRVVCLGIEAALTRVAASMFEIDLGELWIVAVALGVCRALSWVGGYGRHVGRADIIYGVECVGTFARIERGIHPLLCSLGGGICICIGSSWYPRVIQI